MGTQPGDKQCPGLFSPGILIFSEPVAGFIGHAEVVFRVAVIAGANLPGKDGAVEHCLVIAQKTFNPADTIANIKR